MDWAREEQVLAERAQSLIEEGVQLQSLENLEQLERWDDAVNTFLQRLNNDLSTGRFASRRLKRRLDQLIHLYTQVLSAMAKLEADKATHSAALKEARWAING